MAFDLNPLERFWTTLHLSSLMFLFSLSLKTVWYLYQKHSLIQMKPLHWKDPKHSGCHPTPTPSPNLIPGYNSPFHSWVLGCQAFLTGVRLRVTLLWYKPHCFAKLITLLLCKPDTGLYPNKVWPSASLQIKGLATMYTTVK